MSARDRYSSAGAFRTALEQRVRAEAQSSGVPLSRLRKEAAFHRSLDPTNFGMTHTLGADTRERQANKASSLGWPAGTAESARNLSCRRCRC